MNIGANLSPRFSGLVIHKVYRPIVGPAPLQPLDRDGSEDVSYLLELYNEPGVLNKEDVKYTLYGEDLQPTLKDGGIKEISRKLKRGAYSGKPEALRKDLAAALERMRTSLPKRIAGKSVLDQTVLDILLGLVRNPNSTVKIKDNLDLPNWDKHTASIQLEAHNADSQ